MIGDLTRRSFDAEILDSPDIPDHVRKRCYRELSRLHDRLGNTRAIIRRLRKDPLPVRRVLDIGCGHGELLRQVKRHLEVDVVGVDIVPLRHETRIPILHIDAVRDPLPAADVAVSLVMAHHLSSAELAALIRNTGRSCRRFLIVDLVRHWLPAALFGAFVAPFSNPINAGDGIRSLERAYTVHEMNQVVEETLSGTPATFQHEVAPFYIRQIVDIRY